jgi:hypothetical protein
VSCHRRALRGGRSSLRAMKAGAPYITGFEESLAGDLLK